MELTLAQKDALTELINIGYGRAAAALSEMTGYRIHLEVPQLALLDIEEVAPRLRWMMEGEVVCVNQVFSGSIAGNALLLLEQPAALILSQLINDVDAKWEVTSAEHRETVMEVGNILLNPCLGVFGNLPKVQVSFTLPELQLDSIDGVLRSTKVEDEQLSHALMVKTHFHLRARNVSGYLVIILGLTSLVRVLHELDRWQEGLGQ
ncbi:MAG: chemotaxis protein CheC [Opitutaceae bacterium]|nr:chemotaxis protein CheC [Opitutaceae bacterium]